MGGYGVKGSGSVGNNVSYARLGSQDHVPGLPRAPGVCSARHRAARAAPPGTSPSSAGWGEPASAVCSARPRPLPGPRARPPRLLLLLLLLLRAHEEPYAEGEVAAGPHAQQPVHAVDKVLPVVPLPERVGAQELDGRRARQPRPAREDKILPPPRGWPGESEDGELHAPGAKGRAVEAVAAGRAPDVDEAGLVERLGLVRVAHTEIREQQRVPALGSAERAPGLRDGAELHLPVAPRVLGVLRPAARGGRLELPGRKGDPGPAGGVAQVDAEEVRVVPALHGAVPEEDLGHALDEPAPEEEDAAEGGVRVEHLCALLLDGAEDVLCADKGALVQDVPEAAAPVPGRPGVVLLGGGDLLEACDVRAERGELGEDVVGAGDGEGRVARDVPGEHGEGAHGRRGPGPDVARRLGRPLPGDPLALLLRVGVERPSDERRATLCHSFVLYCIVLLCSVLFRVCSALSCRSRSVDGIDSGSGYRSGLGLGTVACRRCAVWLPVWDARWCASVSVCGGGMCAPSGIRCGAVLGAAVCVCVCDVL
ncbi:hypothetical protein CALCODRAFT_85794 [Calocera cornea HHB12733]|uniref:Uncharacterized protein n=1 Tax=Calocera cornea HHB12733 TaxID=1353952 RepID=A0A165IP81_9BASI|nr:hypothetical protein CALCODRAFT_85794 [Calocera cornea HHB12733]